MLIFRALHLITFTATFLHITQGTHKQNVCPTQRSIINVHGKIRIVVWKSKSDSQYSVVLSDPPCLDESNNLVARVCSNGAWTTPKEVCHHVEENTVCPEDFIQDDEKWCISTTEPQRSNGKCPYHGASFRIKENHGSVWLPIERKVRYGPLEYTSPGEKYGLEFHDDGSSEITERFLDVECVIATSSGIELSSCSSLHPLVCSYKYNHFLYHCPDGCVPAGLGSSYCFCKVHERDRKSQSKWCNILATPRYSYERTILQKLVKDDTCWVQSLQRNSNFTLDHFGHRLQLAMNKHEWSLHKDGELNCAVCEVEAMPYRKADLVLKFNPKSQKLHLDLYSPESIFHDDEDMVYCFTDASDKLKKRVETKERWDSDSESKWGRRLKVFRVSIEEDVPGNYWCEAFQLPDMSLVKSNVVVGYKEYKGHEYSLRIVIYNFCRFSVTECRNPSISFITHLSKSLFSSRFFAKFVKKVRLFHIYGINRVIERLDVLLHLTTEAKMPLVAEYFALYRNLQWLRLQKISIVFFRSSEACLPENTFSGDLILRWKLSAIGTIRTPGEICIGENGLPVRRKCEGNFLSGSFWGEVQGNCSQNISLSAKTELLHSLASSDVSSDLTKNISVVTENSTDLTVLDLHYLAEVLLKVSGLNQSSPEEFAVEISQIIDNLMRANATTMKLSQILLNATDEILDTFENTLTSTNASEDLFLLKKSNLIIQVTKPFLNNVSGLVLFGDDDSSFADSKVVYLHPNTTIEDLIEEDDLEVAVYVPETLLNTLSENLTFEAQVNLAVITIIYFSDHFFNSDNDTNTTNVVGSKVVSVSIPGYDEVLHSTIPIVFKSQEHHNDQECAFWNYGLSSETRSGYWSTLGGNYLGQLNNTGLEICSFTHLTNFALLVRTGDLSAPDDENVSYNLTTNGHDTALTIISNIGCSLSLLGLFGIFTTSIIFQSWREKIGTKILIQLCITIFLQIIFLNVADVDKSTEIVSVSFCTIVGIILHYVIISEFCWMLVAAILQFFRFVKVIGPMPDRIILKATIIGWVLPIIPIVIVCAVDYHSYSAGIQGLCYPKGTSMYLGVLFPIGLVVIANLAVFIAVIRNVFVLRVEARSNSQKILKRQIFLAVLLFFLLGLPWIFGLLGEIMNRESVLSYIFIYLFCLTASLQGFVLFVFYVVLDKSTRTLWYTLFKRTLNRNLC